MEENNTVSLDDVKERFKKELSLMEDKAFFESAEVHPMPSTVTEKVVRFEDEVNELQANGFALSSGIPKEYLDELSQTTLSAEAQYIVENYKPNEDNRPSGGLGSYDAYSPEETEIMEKIARGLNKEELAVLKKVFQDTPLSRGISSMMERRKHYVYKTKRNLSINTLIRHYKSVKGKKVDARYDLQSRFVHQTFGDQMKIMRLFLDGIKTEREWCYKTMLHWWDDALTEDLERAWVKYKDVKCVRTATLRLPEAFIKEHQEAMGELDYKNVCLRLAHDESFVIDKARLTPMDYCFVIAHNHRHISDEEADRLLFSHIKELLAKGVKPLAFKTYYGREAGDRLEDKMRYVPSLLYYQTVGYMIWTFGQTGNASTIVKFHQWNKLLQKRLPLYLEEEMNEEDLKSFMNADFWKYKKWNWHIFATNAYQSICRFVPDAASEFLQERRYTNDPFNTSYFDLYGDSMMNGPHGDEGCDDGLDFVPEDLDDCPF